jgi:hypothetical protein
MIYYSTENYLAGSDAALTASSEDTLYVLENLYNGRPSKPFRFTGVGVAGTPEWVCVEFNDPKTVTLAAIFNHNLTALAESADELLLKVDDGTCAGANWAAPDFSLDLSGRLVINWNDLYSFLNQTRLAWRLEVIDTINPDGYAEIGELFLGQYTALTTARLQPGRAEGPRLFGAQNKTPYGQHWNLAYSRAITIELEVWNLNDPATVDAVRLMIETIHDNGSRFVIIPDHRQPFVYYVALENTEEFMSQIVRGLDCELTSWTFQLQTLTKGIHLL